MAGLTPKKRRRLRKTSFAIPSERKYPINDLSHARNALAMVAAHGTASEKRQVRAAVRRKYPSIVQSAPTRARRRTRTGKRR